MSCKNSETKEKVMRAIFTSCLLVVLVGCTGPVDEIVLDETNEQPQEFESGFKVSDGWYFDENILSGLVPEEQGRVFLYKNTDKEVVLGGRLPEDYDTETYADSFIAIRGSVYESELNDSERTWESFFAEYYPEVISFQSATIVAPSLNAVTVTETDGVWLGSKRLFIHNENRFYDLSLHFQNVEQVEAEAVFDNFVQNYNF